MIADLRRCDFKAQELVCQGTAAHRGQLHKLNFAPESSEEWATPYDWPGMKGAGGDEVSARSWGRARGRC